MTLRDVPQDWPFRQNARSARVGRIDWYLIDIGPKDAPVVWMLHGLGASGHSFRQTIDPLAQRFRVIAPDLPGHGFSHAADSRRFGLDQMAEDLIALALALQIPIDAVVGHSAGAALALRLSELTAMKAVVGLNAALGSFDGAAGVLFPLLAKGLAVAPFAATFFARVSGNSRTVERLLSGTGSRLSIGGQAMYLRLIREPRHIAGALGMMAQWKLEPLLERLPALSVPTLLLTGDRDNAVPPTVSDRAAATMRRVEVRHLKGLGHLAHEEAEDGLAGTILPWLEHKLQPTMDESAPNIIGR
jgi:magnesium chelatase accessory protein